MTTSSAALDFMMLRMQHKPDFPTLSESVKRIVSLVDAENESIASLSNSILKDVALTQKLLRLVNSTYYRHHWGGNISTVSRAVALIGLQGIRNLVLSLVVMETLRNKEDVGHLYEELLRGLAMGTLAHELSASPAEAEEAFVSGLMQNLGRMLVQFYFPEESREIRRQMVKQFKGQTPGPADWDKVVNEVIKMSFGDLGLGVAIRWGLPDALVFSMRRYPLTAEPNPPREPAERMRLLASAAHELVEVMQSGDEHQLSTAIDQIAQRYDKAMGLTPKQLGAAVAGSRARMQELVKALRIPVRAGSVASHWMDHASDFVPLAPESDAATQALALPDGAQDLSTHAYPQATKPIDVLSAGISDVINSMVEDDFKLNAVIRVALETMYRAFKFERVVFCLRNPKAGKLVGKIALGTDAQYMPERFQIDLVKVLQPQADLFTAVCHKGLDTLISDANVPSLALRLPQWYCNGVNAPTFLLLPLRHKDITIGLIYADKPEAGTITLSDREFSQLGTLRSQLVMAFRQATQGSAPKAA